jgi:hypothetical protein
LKTWKKKAMGLVWQITEAICVMLEFKTVNSDVNVICRKDIAS